MAKVNNICQVKTGDLKPYEKNAKIHTQNQVEKIARSISEFGFLSPVLIDENKNIIAGHGRVLAAKMLGLDAVPCVNISGLSEEQRRAYILADNKIAEESAWDDELVNMELQELARLDFDIDLTGFDLEEDWFESRERYDNDTEEETEEYKDFVEKFEPKRTTDDCYTPDNVYAAVSDYVRNHYGIKDAQIARPFYPGGDYQKYNYTNAVVVDNPPFSILAEIIKFYVAGSIPFFIFAPTLTMLSSVGDVQVCCVSVGIQIVYENGAIVNTSFITNLEDARIKSAPDLYLALDAENKKNIKDKKKIISVMEYPPEVITAPMIAKLSKNGADLTISRKDSARVTELDAMKEHGKSIFGGGFLISERAAAERAAAERAAAERAAAERAADGGPQRGGTFTWSLSPREEEIVKGLGADG